MQAARRHLTPIRDERPAPSDSVHRELDGVPHAVVGLSALFSVLFAAVVLGMWLSGSTGRVTAVLLCLIGVPMMVSSLRQRSERERREIYPSR